MHVLYELLLGEHGFETPARAHAHTPHLQRVGQHPQDLFRQVMGIASPNLQSLFVLDHRVTKTAAVGKKDRYSGCHGFNDHQWLPLLLDAGKYEQTRRLVQPALALAFPHADERDSTLQAVRSDEFLGVAAILGAAPR